MWAGVGGDENVTNPAVVVQAGISASVQNGAQFNESWWEVFPDSGAQHQQDLPLARLAVGDDIYVAVTSNLNNDGYDYFFIENITVDSYNSCTLPTTGNVSDTCNSPGGASLNSDSASGECIVERPSYNNSPLHLAQYQGIGQPTDTLLVSYCTVNGSAIGTINHHDDTMTGSGGNVISKPGPITGNGYEFTCVWHSPGY